MSNKTKKTLSLILLITIFGTVAFSLSACNDEKDTGFKTHYIEYEIFDIKNKRVDKKSGESFVSSTYGIYRYKYDGTPCKLTIDVIVIGTGERFKHYEMILIDFYKYNEETREYDHTSGGFQNNELEWPTEIGKYEIHFLIDSQYENINGMEYLKYYQHVGSIDLIIEG